ncbi:MAG: ribulose-phosphate 3-epimerase [Clostridia bacterium]
MIKVAPSILAADFMRMGEEIDKAHRAGADYLHFDVMDGCFVPNITFGQCILSAAARGPLPLDVHLMIDRPERFIESFAEAGARIITVHAEATHHLQRVLSQIRACGCLAGVSLNPATTPDCLRYVLGDFDLALVMTVNPGFGGQKLIPQVVSKIGEIKGMLTGAGVDAEIEVDGGVSLSSAQPMIDQGATMLVAGSAFYGASDPAAFVKGLKAMARRG